MVRFLVGLLFGLLIFAPGAMAQTESAEGAGDEQANELLYVIYDSSNSMWGELADKSRKYEAGRKAMTGVLADGVAGRSLAFRAYGHRRKTDCRDSELIVEAGASEIAGPKISKAINAIRPTGKTPITYSLRESLKDFGDRKGDILLISDGIETCDIDPCALMEEWRNQGIGIRVHVVGVGLIEVERRAMACVAETSGGKYFDAGSEAELIEAMNAAVVIEPGDPEPVIEDERYGLKITAADETGRSFIVTGTLFKDGVEIMPLTSNGKQWVEEPGDYTMTVGVLLKDGTIYKPVSQPVSIVEPGVTRANVIVTRPAIVSASFSEAGEEQRGGYVTAFQGGKKIFGFRAFDEALARPGTYEFQTEPNADNKLSLTEALVEGDHTELNFALATTIKFYVRFKLPNGETFRRASELWRDGERVYKVFSGNPTTVRPGIYELRSDDQNLPLTPVEIEIKNDGETIETPIDAGWIKISYAVSEFDYVGEPDRAWIESLDRGNSKYARLATEIPVAPGRYKANPQTSKGFFDPVEIDVVTNQTVEAVFTPQPLGEIIVNYAPSGNWPKVPDRASVEVLDGQAILNGFMRPGVAKKFLPGRYRVRGGGSSSDAVAQEITVKAHETHTVTLKHKLDE